jgi:hypothetical protein
MTDAGITNLMSKFPLLEEFGYGRDKEKFQIDCVVLSRLHCRKRARRGLSCMELQSIIRAQLLYFNSQQRQRRYNDTGKPAGRAYKKHRRKYGSRRRNDRQAFQELP